MRAAAVLGAVFVLLLVGVYFGAWRGSEEGPGRLGAIDDCGALTMDRAGGDWRWLCFPGIWGAISASQDGRTIAWDIGPTDPTPGIAVADAYAQLPNMRHLTLPIGANLEPSLSPDGKKVAFLHSPRDDGRYDIWIASTRADANDAEQVTAERDVSSLAWSPTGDEIAYVRGWSPESLVGDLVVVRTDGTDERVVGRGDTPSWSPDGDRLAFARDGAVWTMRADGGDERLVARNADAPAWSRDGSRIAFMRSENCREEACKAQPFIVGASGGTPTLVDLTFPDPGRLVWLPERTLPEKVE